MKVNSAHEPSGPSGRSLSRCLLNEATSFLLSPGWYASPWQGYPQHYVYRCQFMHLDGERHCEGEVSLPRTHPRLEPGLFDPETSTLTMKHRTALAPFKATTKQNSWSSFALCCSLHKIPSHSYHFSLSPFWQDKFQRRKLSSLETEKAKKEGPFFVGSLKGWCPLTTVASLVRQ